MSKILIAEDEPRIAAFLEKGLKASGFITAVARNGNEVSQLIDSQDFDLMILDIGLPVKDGWTVLEEVRGRGNSLPIIILTARTSVIDTVAGLEGGADDYMTKPFRFEELLARVRLRLRYHRPLIPHDDLIFRVGKVSLNLRTRQLQVDNHSVELSAREFALMETLMRHPGQIISREQLLNHVWGYDYDAGSNIVDVYISSIRKKIGDDSIKTVRGIGYQLKI